MKKEDVKIWHWIRFVSVIVVIVAAFFLTTYVGANSDLQMLVVRYGYVGAFVMAVISGFNLLFPIPAPAFLPVLITAGLDPILSLVVMALGTTMADSIAFYLGKTGRNVVGGRMRKHVKKLDRMRCKHPWEPIVFLFIYAAVMPFPNEILAIPLGLIGCRGRHVIPALFFGNLLFNAAWGYGFVTAFNVF